MMKLRAVPGDVADISARKTRHQPRGEKFAGNEVHLLVAVVGYGKHKGVSERTDPRPTITSTLYNFQLHRDQHPWLVVNVIFSLIIIIYIYIYT